MTSNTPADSIDLVAIQRRTLQLLFCTQIIGAVGVSVGVSVGALLAAEMAGTSLSGLAQSSVVLGAALLALPVTKIVQHSGRRLSLTSTYIVAALGSMLIVMAAMQNSLALLFPGYFLFGAATAANFQARYAAVDLAPAELRGRHLSLIVWATTIGAIVGPNLTQLSGKLTAPYGLPTLAAPFVLSAMLFVVAAVVLTLFLRPDPAVVARETLASTTAHAAKKVGLRAAFNVVSSIASARLGMIATSVGHVVMVGVMAMTPVHIRGAGYDAPHTLRVVGIVISFHIAGMYAFSPLVGWLTDKVGRREIIMTGLACLIGASAVAAIAGHDTFRLAAGLMLLGFGWSCTMVAGSTLLNESIPLEMRPSAQGLSDFVMGLAGATAGALSGVVVGTWNYQTLGLVAALVAAPFLLIMARRART